MNIIEVKNINFKYKDKQIFKDFNLNIKESTFTSIIGLNGSGKSTLIKIILGLFEFEGNIKINNLPLNKKNNREYRWKSKKFKRKKEKSSRNIWILRNNSFNRKKHLWFKWKWKRISPNF